MSAKNHLEIVYEGSHFHLKIYSVVSFTLVWAILKEIGVFCYFAIQKLLVDFLEKKFLFYMQMI